MYFAIYQKKKKKYIYIYIYSFFLETHNIRGVHQIEQIAKTTLKPPTKWHNHIAPQVTVHRTARCSAICGFIIRKSHKPHHTTPHPLYILIYLFFNIKYIINSLITLIFKKEKKFNNLSKC